MSRLGFAEFIGGRKKSGWIDIPGILEDFRPDSYGLSDACMSGNSKVFFASSDRIGVSTERRRIFREQESGQYKEYDVEALLSGLPSSRDSIKSLNFDGSILTYCAQSSTDTMRTLLYNKNEDAYEVVVYTVPPISLVYPFSSVFIDEIEIGVTEISFLYRYTTPHKLYTIRYTHATRSWGTVAQSGTNGVSENAGNSNLVSFQGADGRPIICIVSNSPTYHTLRLYSSVGGVYPITPTRSVTSPGSYWNTSSVVGVFIVKYSDEPYDFELFSFGGRNDDRTLIDVFTWSVGDSTPTLEHKQVGLKAYEVFNSTRGHSIIGGGRNDVVATGNTLTQVEGGYQITSMRRNNTSHDFEYYENLDSYKYLSPSSRAFMLLDASGYVNIVAGAPDGAQKFRKNIRHKFL